MFLLSDLKNASLNELEQIYTNTAEAPLNGAYRGIFLCRLDSPSERRPLHWGSRAFEFVPFGIDFDSCNWFFFHPRLQVAKFRMEEGSSRWRSCSVVKMHYEVSCLPQWFKGVLYDEVKPLSDKLCLGLGGFNKETGEGDQFYFALVRISSS